MSLIWPEFSAMMKRRNEDETFRKKTYRSDVEDGFALIAFGKAYGTKTPDIPNCCIMSDGKDFYVMFFRISESFIENYPAFEDFHYQDQTDKSADVSDEEWEARDDKREELFAATSVPSEAGATIALFSEYKATLYATNRWRKENEISEETK